MIVVLRLQIRGTSQLTRINFFETMLSVSFGHYILQAVILDFEFVLYCFIFMTLRELIDSFAASDNALRCNVIACMSNITAEPSLLCGCAQR